MAKTTKHQTASKPTKVPKVVKSESPKSKPELSPHVNRKQINEIILLGLVLILVAVVVYLTMIKKPVEVLPEESVIPTEFEEQSLNEIKKRDSNYPSVNTEDLGKPNPFSN
ncbi:TPA: hypothetical protein EYO12_04450 [Candidatus Saccharibacteria bacterium]|nr:hypothetical protein [Candidatus Saccharibacteria bacterium]HIO87714.1 hypothetical protein [Candidatus Saccharibacteria bacterium]